MAGLIGSRVYRAFTVIGEDVNQPDDLTRTREAGFDEHVTKPADLKQILRLAAGGAAQRPALHPS